MELPAHRRAVLDGNLPSAPIVALSAARRYRSILRCARLSLAARAYLETDPRELERRANDETARVIQIQQAQEQPQSAQSRNDIGIYVNALPRYLRYPFEPDSGRTLMKVSRSDSDVMRFRSQTRTTALPEEPILLRIYLTDRLLEAADHSRSVSRSAGRDGFVTSTRVLDEIAKVMKLSIEIVNGADAVGDD